MLTYDEDLLLVPKEETLLQIVDRYLLINSHALSYTWKDVDGRLLDMDKTLDENDLLDEVDLEDENGYIPTLMLYFNDDLT